MATAAPAERRTLTFNSMSEILAEVERLAAGPIESLGDWTPAQNIDHVRRVVTTSLDGFDFAMPWPIRVFGKLLKGRTIAGGLRPGLKIPAAATAAFAPPEDITLDEALELFRRDVGRAITPGSMSQPSPLFGPMTHDDWERLHCRHAELHLGFLVPSTDR